MAVVRKEDGTVVCARCVVADSAWTRTKGLLGRASLDEDEGILLRPGGSIHMFFMRFPIDAVFLDRELTCSAWRPTSGRGGWRRNAARRPCSSSPPAAVLRPACRRRPAGDRPVALARARIGHAQGQSPGTVPGQSGEPGALPWRGVPRRSSGALSRPCVIHHERKVKRGLRRHVRGLSPDMSILCAGSVPNRPTHRRWAHLSSGDDAEGPLRIQFAGGVHVTARGNRRLDSRARRSPAVPPPARRRPRVAARRCHLYCLMPNHVHLVVETSAAASLLGMQRLSGMYAQSFNHRHELSGHLFEGRFDSTVVESNWHLLERSSSTWSSIPSAVNSAKTQPIGRGVAIGLRPGVRPVRVSSLRSGC